MTTAPTVADRARASLLVRGVVDSCGRRVPDSPSLGVIVLLAFLGPWFIPYDPTATLMLPLEAPSARHLMGADALGRDALSRYLNGGQRAGRRRIRRHDFRLCHRHPARHGDRLSTRPFRPPAIAIADLILAFPAIIFVLVLAAAAGTSLSVVILGIAIINLPRVVRIARTVTIDLVTREFVEASIARGESLLSILRSDILPNIWTPILADFGIRLTDPIILFSSLSYLGFGQQPPAADWGLMISENRRGTVSSALGHRRSGADHRAAVHRREPHRRRRRAQRRALDRRTR